MSINNEHLIVCANIIHETSEDNFYKIILTSYENNELILKNPEAKLANIPQIEPFKTKSKIKHSPPKSPSKDVFLSSQEPFPEDNDSNEDIMKVYVDKIFKNKEEEIFNEFSPKINDFLEKKSNILLINWFKRLSDEGFLGFIKKKFQNFNDSSLKFAINGIFGDIENVKKQNYQEISNFEKEFMLWKSSKRNMTGLIYRFMIENKANHQKNYLVLVDLFNVIEKFNGISNISDTLNNIGKEFYRFLTDKTSNSDKKGEIYKIFKKIMSNNNFYIVSLINFRDIEPYYMQNLQGLKFIDELNQISKKFQNSSYFQIFYTNQEKILMKNFAYQKELIEIKSICEISKENLEKFKAEIKSIEKLKTQLKEKDEIIKKMNQEKIINEEDRSLLAGILEDTVTNSAESVQPIKKIKVFY